MPALAGDNRVEAAKRLGISRPSPSTRIAHLDIGWRRISGHACPGALTPSLPHCRQSLVRQSPLCGTPLACIARNDLADRTGQAALILRETAREDIEAGTGPCVVVISTTGRG
ncbi:hypothetical protein D5R55_19615 [Burkholderia cenocepacia]|uniref:Uncharacterized protein n=1 Tax=Burkholderia cenocepacia TaxID=95486 RepID=A0A3Q9FAF8_9BURK|nr:hypothetical protein D5R55_19615 [Burkholderia cenocepacia]